MSATPPPPALGTQAPPFNLPSTDGRNYTFRDVAGKNGTVIVFICNHCPYVKAVIDRLVADARMLMGEGIGFAAIGRMTPAPILKNSFTLGSLPPPIDFPFLIFTTRPSLSRRSMMRSARRISSASISRGSSCTVGRPNSAARSRRRRAPSASWSMPCATLPKPAHRPEPERLDRLFHQMESDRCLISARPV